MARSRLSLTACLFSAFVVSLTVAAPAQAQSTRTMMNRLQQMQKAERDQMVKELQSQMTEAQTSLTKADADLAAAAADLQSARSQQQSAKEQLDAKEKEEQAAVKQMRDAEEAVLAAQGPDSEYAKAQADVEAKQVGVDEVVHKVLGLPPHSGATTEQERSMERVKLSPDKKAKLKSNSEYTKAEEAVKVAQSRVSDIRKKLLEQDSAWSAAHTAKQTADQDAKTLQANLKTASAAAAASQKKTNAATAKANALREGINEIAMNLNALGAQPAPASR
ncbi:hypothetical protein [Planctomicrobium piriforme]|uniref:Colicin import membrane protein n=1 Tax=Planctomicrobium piriforme TaxID=1576369 RepID=A0A1I3T6F1_9PLAN|nr:hypothetical protein [Planctomicrobium piriforme]SFJ66718.1 hypothetical protein SAMN05421753_12811 [Planctomicrobium piriforme]